MSIAANASVTLAKVKQIAFDSELAVCLNRRVTPKQNLIERLGVLCKAHGVDTVADLANISADNLRQVLAGTKLKSGKPRGVGPAVQEALETAYPGWSVDPPQAAVDSSSESFSKLALGLASKIDAISDADLISEAYQAASAAIAEVLHRRSVLVPPKPASEKRTGTRG